MTKTVGPYRFDTVVSYPLWGWWCHRGTFRPEDNAGTWFVRCRLGYLQVRVTKQT